MTLKITKEDKFRNAHGQVMSFFNIANRIKEWINEEPDKDYVIAIGTDSQSYDEAKVVVAITVHRLHSGGIFFIKSMRHKTFGKNQLHEKLYTETQLSLDTTELLLEEFFDIDFDITEMENIHLKIHIDVGKNGPTKEYIRELEGWIRAMGYDTEIKPDSYAASYIADKYSK